MSTESSYRHLFGPVISRRLGRSLGIDVIGEEKVCGFDCLYCECGITVHKTLKREEWVPLDDIKGELTDYFHNPHPDVEWLTITGNGEPTQYRRLRELIAFCREVAPELRVAVLSNATLLDQPEVREDLALVDLLKVSLDGGSQTMIRKVDRPVRECTLENIVTGITSFRRGYPQVLMAVEILFLQGFNEAESEVENMVKICRQISPDTIHLSTVVRHPAYPGLAKPLSVTELAKISESFSGLPVDIPVRYAPRDRHTQNQTWTRTNLTSSVLSWLKRRPGGFEELCEGLQADRTTLKSCLETLVSQKKLTTVPPQNLNKYDSAQAIYTVRE